MKKSEINDNAGVGWPPRAAGQPRKKMKRERERDRQREGELGIGEPKPQRVVVTLGVCARVCVCVQ